MAIAVKATTEYCGTGHLPAERDQPNLWMLSKTLSLEGVIICV